MTSNTRRMLASHAASVSMAIALSALAAPSFAQDASTTPAQNDAQRAQAEAAPLGVADIVVTAQRREERNQDVPITITAFSSDRLKQQNVTSGQDLNGLVPSLTVSSQGQASRNVEAFMLRGQAPTYQGSASVVNYLSEVPLIQAFTTSQQGGPGNFVDLENVQVLAGPQGTLFGRNTTGGAVLMVPHRPTNDLEGYLQASFGNYNYRGAEGVLNVPIIEDKLLVRVSGTYQDRDGFTQDLVWNKDRDNLHYYAGRIGITFKPNERIENYLLLFGARSKTNGSGYVLRGFNLPVLQAFQQCTSPCTVYSTQVDIANQIGPRQVRHDLDDFEDLKTWGAVNKTNVELNDSLTLRNIFSYQRLRYDYDYDTDGSPLQLVDVGSNRFPSSPVPGLSQFGVPSVGFTNFPESLPRDNLRQITEELQLQGSFLDKRLTVTAGGFYYDQKPVSDQFLSEVGFCPADFTGFCPPSNQSYGVHSRSKALYAQGTFDFGALSPSLENLRLTGGYRYTWDTISGFSSKYTQNGPSSFTCTTTNQVVTSSDQCAFSAQLNSSAPTWIVGLDYRPASKFLIFAKISRGYKAGGFNPGAVNADAQTFQPEFVTNYEGGFKSDWMVGAVPFRLNLTAYSMDYKNIQRAIGDFNPSTNAIGNRNIQASARIRGIEAEATVRPFAGVEIGGNVSYTDAKWKQLSYVAPLGGVGCNGVVAAGATIDQTCTPFGTAKWIYSIHTSIDIPVPETWGRLNFYANYSYISEQDQTLLPAGLKSLQPGSIIAPYGLLNMSARWNSVARSNFDLEAFINNATNKLYVVSNTNVFQFGYWAELYGTPRMYGLRLRYRFGGKGE